MLKNEIYKVISVSLIFAFFLFIPDASSVFIQDQISEYNIKRYKIKENYVALLSQIDSIQRLVNTNEISNEDLGEALNVLINKYDGLNISHLEELEDYKNLKYKYKTTMAIIMFLIAIFVWIYYARLLEMHEDYLQRLRNRLLKESKYGYAWRQIKKK